MEQKKYTLDEARIILEAEKQNKEYINLEIQSLNGNWTAPFCGSCGRIVHHPDCPKANWSSNDNEEASQT